MPGPRGTRGEANAARKTVLRRGGEGTWTRTRTTVAGGGVVEVVETIAITQATANEAASRSLGPQQHAD